MDDLKLIRNCQKGEKGAFQELIAEYRPFVFKFLIKLSGDEQVAEDLTQDTFIKVIRNIDKYDLYKNARFSTYIITVAKNCYIDGLKKESRHKTGFIDENIEFEDRVNIEDSVIAKLDAQSIMNKMEELTLEQQTVIKLKYIEDLTLKEIGEMLKLEPKTVKSRIHNGIAKLRQLMERGD